MKMKTNKKQSFNPAKSSAGRSALDLTGQFRKIKSRASRVSDPPVGSNKKSGAGRLFALSGVFKNFPEKINSPGKIILPLSVFAGTMLISGGEFIFGICPFGIAAMCAVPSPVLLVAAFAGAMLRSALLSWGSVMYMLIYFALFVLRGGMFIISLASETESDMTVYRLSKKSRITKTALPAAAAAATVGLAISAAEGSFTVYTAFSCAAGAAAAGVCAFLFGYLFPSAVSGLHNENNHRIGAGGKDFYINTDADLTSHSDLNKSVNLGPDESIFPTQEELSAADFRRRSAAITALIYAVVLSMRGMTLFSMSMSTIAAYATALIMSRIYGAGGGTLAATAAGIAQGAVYAPVYAVCAAVNGFLSRRSPAFRISAAFLLSMGWAVMDRGLSAVSDILPEAAIVTAAAIPVARYALGGVLTRSGRRGKADDSGESPRGSGRIMNMILGYTGAAASSPTAEHRVKKELDSIRFDAAADRLRSLSGALTEVGEVLTKMSKRMRTPMKWECRRLCDAVMNESCPSCPHTGLCWNREYSSTSALSARLAARLAENGSISSADFPDYLLNRCPRIEAIAGNINFRYRSLWEKCGDESPSAPDFLTVSQLIDDIVAFSESDGEIDGEKSRVLKEALDEAGLKAGCVSVYGKRSVRVFIDDIRLPGIMLGESDIRDMCSRVAGRPMKEVEFSIDGDRISAYLESAPVLGAKWGRASAPGSAEVSGDSLAVFSGEGERLVALISDGMGSGEEAALMSGMGTVVMKRLLKAGCSPAAALKLLNRILCDDRFECTVTMDILDVDRLSGKCTVMKSGAAPSFVVRDGRLICLSGATLPLGILSSPDASLSSFEGQPGDIIVMLSDGIDADGGDCPWLTDLLSDPRCAALEEEVLAGLILEKSRMGQSRDDATALVVRLKEAA